MDDQNSTNQPIDPKMTPISPNVLEDITPVETPPMTTPSVTTTTTTVSEPTIPTENSVSEVPQAEPMMATLPIEIPTGTPLPGASTLPEPTPMTTETTTTTITETPTVNESIPVQAEVPQPKTDEIQMPERKPKKKIMPVVMGVLALFLVVGVAGAAYYVSNQLSSRVAVAPNAPTSKPMAGGVALGGNYNSVVNPSAAIGRKGSIILGTSLETSIVTLKDGSQATFKNVSGYYVAPDGNYYPVGGGNTTQVPTEPPAGNNNAVAPAAAGCVNYSFIPDSTSEQQNQIICSPDRSHINTVSFATAGTIRVHLNNVYVGTTITLTKDGANATVTKVAEGASGWTTADFDATVVAGTYTMTIKLGNEANDSLGYINPTSAGICERYGGPNDISSKITTSALTGFGIATTTGVDAPFQCWSDEVQGSDTDQRGQLDANYDFNDFDVEIGYKGTTTVGACTIINVYKKVNGVYVTTPLTTSQLQNLSVGDVLQFYLGANMDNLQGRFRVTINGTAGDWLTGTVDSSKRNIVYSDYTVAAAGTYTFEAQVSTTAQ